MRNLAAHSHDAMPSPYPRTGRACSGNNMAGGCVWVELWTCTAHRSMTKEPFTWGAEGHRLPRVRRPGRAADSQCSRDRASGLAWLFLLLEHPPGILQCLLLLSYDRRKFELHGLELPHDDVGDG